MVPEEARTRPATVAFEPHLDPEGSMQDVGGSCLHASDADRVEAFVVHPCVSSLSHHELSILDLNVADIKLGVEPDFGVVRVLLEVVDHPVGCEILGLLVIDQVGHVWIVGEVLEQSVGVDISCFFIFVATWTMVDRGLRIDGCGSDARDDESEQGRTNHVVQCMHVPKCMLCNVVTGHREEGSIVEKGTRSKYLAFVTLRKVQSS